ncbi:hypothetical protein [Embleya hyalina]|uniref:hypothetical protein n=1 Tax=Embleya hyalina TaxID=516124 RepID=UPI000F83DA21|nr:hypothetical protein [Embleya hyalina]
MRHARWGPDADADEVPEHLDLREVPEVVQARRRWAGVVRRATRAGVDPSEVFGVAWAVVCRWWESALSWEREVIWPRRLHAVAGGDAGGDFAWWRVVGRDAVVFPEAVAVADALLDPAWCSDCGATAVPGGRGRCGRTGRLAANSGNGSGGRGWDR